MVCIPCQKAAAQKAASRESLLIDERVTSLSALSTDKLKALLQAVVETRNIPGAMAEVGVWRGGSARLLARAAPSRKLHLMDTFSGIPVHSPVDVHRIGDFGDTSLSAVQDALSDCTNVKFHPGVFTATAPSELGPFSLVHIDADQYQTTADALKYFYPRMSRGGVLVLDDYLWPRCPGVVQAVREFLVDKPEVLRVTTDYQAQLVCRQDWVGPLHVHMNATGLGDAVCGMYAACGLSDYYGRSVIYHVRHPEWLARVSHPNITVTPYSTEDSSDLSANYGAQMASGMDRKQWYCQNVNPNVVPTAPQRIDRTVTERRVEAENYVVLSPYSAYSCREWPGSHWRYLSTLLQRAGLKPIVVGSEREFGRAQTDFGPTTATWYIGSGAEEVQDILLGAQCVVGNDSGIAHLSGLLGMPTVAVHSQLEPHILFSHTDVLSLTPDTDCAFCRWDGGRGWANVCGSECSALASIAPQQVMEAVCRLIS